MSNQEEKELEGSVSPVPINSSIGDISVVCSIPEARTVRASELSRLLRVDKQALVQVIEIHFADGRVIIDNLLEVSSSSRFLEYRFLFMRNASLSHRVHL